MTQRLRDHLWDRFRLRLKVCVRGAENSVLFHGRGRQRDEIKVVIAEIVVDVIAGVGSTARHDENC
jgi:hypothetical protein